MKKIIFVIIICLGLLTIAYLQFDGRHNYDDPRGETYAGAAACVKCHSATYNSYIHTAHYIASVAANSNSVHGSFIKGSNEFIISDSQKVVMEKRGNKMYQSYYLRGKLTGSHPFDVVFGGVKGESYLYWKDKELNQLPLSYFTKEDKWSTSPGYGFSFVDYRSIGIRCMECHTSYINRLDNKGRQLTGNEQFEKSSLVYGIDCERCHGPGANHVDFQTANPTVKEAKFIVKYSALNQKQKIDACAVCHSGIHNTLVRSTFGFMPGDTLAKFTIPEFQQHIDTTHIDVHGKQVQLLQGSKCYLNSKMECSTCHDVHQNARGNSLLFAQKCLGCHNKPGHVYCKINGKLTANQLVANCTSCHMPQQTTKVISVQLSAKNPPAAFFVHTHHIAIYPQETKKIMAFINK